MRACGCRLEIYSCKENEGGHLYKKLTLTGSLLLFVKKRLEADCGRRLNKSLRVKLGTKKIQIARGEKRKFSCFDMTTLAKHTRASRRTEHPVQPGQSQYSLVSHLERLPETDEVVERLKGQYIPNPKKKKEAAGVLCQYVHLAQGRRHPHVIGRVKI